MKNIDNHRIKLKYLTCNLTASHINNIKKSYHRMQFLHLLPIHFETAPRFHLLFKVKCFRGSINRKISEKITIFFSNIISVQSVNK